MQRMNFPTGISKRNIIIIITEGLGFSQPELTEEIVSSKQSCFIQF